MTPRRCFDCGARAADGADVRECDGCTFGVCEAHGDEGDKRRCEGCKRLDEKEAAMSEKMPESMTEEAVAEWVHSFIREGLPDWDQYTTTARAVLALVEAKVKLAAAIAYDLYAQPFDPDVETAEQYGERHAKISREIVARVMGKEAPHA